jgi:hypothetical protein
VRAVYYYCPTCTTVHAKPLCSTGVVDDARVAPAVHGDECDFVQENGTREPIRFRSRQAFRQWLDAKDIRLREKFTPMPGTDKDPSGVMNPNGYIDAYTLEAKKALVLRALSAPKPGPDESPETVTDLPTTWTARDAGIARVRR